MTLLLWARKGGPSVVAPTLSSPNAGTPTGSGSTGASVSTDTGNGTLYWAVVTNGGSATNAQIKAGTGGNIVAGVAGNQAVSGTGTQTLGTISGLASSTTYQLLFLQTSGASVDSLQVSVGLTTAAGDPYWSSVIALYFNEQGANTSQTFVDQSSLATTLTSNGSGFAWTTTTPPTGLTSSAGATGGKVTTDSTAAFAMGSGDFTVEFWSKASSTGTYFGFASGVGFDVYMNGTNVVINSVAGVSQLFSNARGVMADGSWHHFAWIRSGSTNTMYYDGIAQATTKSDSTNWNTTNVVTIAQGVDGTFQGKLASLRITKVARWTSNFTPPTLPLPNS